MTAATPTRCGPSARTIWWSPPCCGCFDEASAKFVRLTAGKPPAAALRAYIDFVGECVALVVAETHEAAYDALERIEVRYETLAAVIDEEAAIGDTAPQLHENVPNNITTHFKIGGGDYAAAARQADHILRLRLVNNRLIPTCLETRAILAEPSVDGRLTIYLPSQVPHMHRRWIAETVGIPEHLLRVVAPNIGGGFGAKMHLYP
jgi:aerobic carbon-monoxide dehydrogenase large subunit